MKKVSAYTVLYSDQHIIVLNKPSGLLIAADRYNEEAPRLDLLAEKEFGKLYAVHRIDKDTSGIIIYARTAEAHKNLSIQFEKHTIQKTYHCIVHGHPSWETMRADQNLLPDGDSKHKTIVVKKGGKPSVTDFSLIGYCGPYAWIEARPLTGRTHQIRVHLAKNGFPIICDPLYNGNLHPVILSELKKKWSGDELSEKPLLNRLALHAYSIEFDHPETGKRCYFSAPYQRDMEAVRNQFNKLYGVDPFSWLKNSN